MDNDKYIVRNPPNARITPLRPCEYDLDGVNLVYLLRVLYNGSGTRLSSSRPFDYDQARALAKRILWVVAQPPEADLTLQVHSFCGRVIEPEFSRATARGEKFDIATQPGAFGRAVRDARTLTQLAWRLGMSDPEVDEIVERDGTPPPPYTEG
ncbi:uncharacterized protein BO97DRAFT_408831 [Aspergillus homomorphus CBS 101889]|uniref:Uncharacterized protein n=1 Tax=Aspergillus homomorphus (strain CBS 101889) TaxID=1450537 RepID=A0A395HMW2_ASPHC|nr:hypothetical protein BO97DRAFT_408831 [Aspergillus homomorphus CBS 101889]RAL07614.1 hypothetical protein BO97DRAFT_408831 [Aspergillus homomorphus CBS 101889]